MKGNYNVSGDDANQRKEGRVYQPAEFNQEWQHMKRDMQQHYS